MTGFNIGATASANNAASCAIAIPSGVLAGDVMVLNITLFTESSTAPTVSFSGGGGSWGLVPLASGTNPAESASGSIYVYQYLYYRVATSGDPGASLTASESGSPSGSTWWGVELASYTGFYASSPIDVAASAALNPGNSGNAIVAPSLLTQRPGSWPAYTMGGGLNSGSTVTYSGVGTAQREFVNSSAGIGGAIYDQGGSVAQGTGFGGGTFTVSNGNNWLCAFSVALATQAIPGPTPVGVTPPQIPHPLWLELLEVAEGRVDWQAQGVASLQQQHWRTMDGQFGRPSAGPSAATSYSGGWVSGYGFYVTQGGMWLEGYWWWVCSSGGQPATAQKFALWSVVNSGGSFVPGSAVTSGALSPGWNWVPLPQPVQLCLYGAYVAATGVNGPYPSTAGYFNSGGAYPGGLQNGPLAGFSDANGGNPTPPSYPGTNGCFNTTGTDPAQVMPTSSDSNAGTNYWLDVQVTNTPPAGYAGEYRIWPNTADASYGTSGDSAVNYVVGTDLTLTVPSVITKLWYFVPSGTAQFATSVDIWRVSDQVRVATQPNPVWRQAGGAPATSASGLRGSSQQWVWCDPPGTVALPAGEYRVSVYNGAASPDGWSAKALGYWQSYSVTPEGTFNTAAPGAAGIVNGPISVPTTPLSSATRDYLQPAVTEPGQSVFAVGPPNQYPNVYVGTPVQLFQNYWVDVSAVPASAYFAQAPVEPQPIPHPLWYELLELAPYHVSENAAPHPGGAVLSGAGSLSGAATEIAGGAAALAGAGSLTAAGELTGSAGLSGAGALAATGGIGLPGAAALAGAGSLTAAAALAGAAALSGAGSLGASGAYTVEGSAGLSGSGSLAAGGQKTVPGAVTLSGTGSLAATAQESAPGSAALFGSGALSAAATLAATAALSGSGSLSAAGVLAASAALSGAGSLSAAGQEGTQGAAAMSGAGSLSAAAGNGSAATLAGSGTLAAAATAARTAAAALAGVGTLTATGTSTGPAAGVLFSAAGARHLWSASAARRLWAAPASRDA